MTSPQYPQQPPQGQPPQSQPPYQYQGQPPYQPYHPYQQYPQGPRPGKGAATGSLVCGIIGIVLWLFGWSSIISVILGVVGLMLASSAKKAGFDEGIRTAGFVLSLLSLIFGGVIFLACVACAGTLGTAGLLTS